MHIEKQAENLDAGITDVATKLDILCPNCGRDVDEVELENAECSDCGTSLTSPQQNVAVYVTSVPIFAVTF